MKKILGLDLGTTSIGWAYVHEAENEGEVSSIKKLGVRVNPLTTDEQADFEKGKSMSVNADRTLKRGARRNLDRYQDRRKTLLETLFENKFITKETSLAEEGENTTHSTYKVRAKAAVERVEKEDIARIFLSINKKRGYKSSRKTNDGVDGEAVDGMAVAKRLYEENLTPGQLAYKYLNEGKKILPDFYRSDLKAEFDKIYDIQKLYYPEILTDELYKAIENQGLQNTRKRILAIAQVYTAENKGKRDERKLQAYQWRSEAVSKQLEIEKVAYVLTEINNDLNSSSGYLGAISDRSKKLYFNNETVGQYLYKQLQDNPHTRLKGQVFYRQDYLDEFEKIWETQKEFYPEMTPNLKEEIRDTIIFYQRRLKSQKGLIGFCEFESEQKLITVDGKEKIKTIGSKVIPKSSPLFQEFKIWQNLSHVVFKNKKTKELSIITDWEVDSEIKNDLFQELNIKGNLLKTNVLKIVFGKSWNEWDMNFSALEGNRTNEALYEAYQKIIQLEGNEAFDFKKLEASEAKEIVKDFFETIGIDSSILEFNAELELKEYQKQSSYQLWHLLYSYEGDNSKTGNDKLYEKLEGKFGFKREYAKILANVSLLSDYAGLSAKAIRKIYPFIKEKNYSDACELAGYNHSKSVSKEENLKRELKPRLDLLSKNSLRNPVVEKILNQMVNVVNAVIDHPDLGKPDEIRIELARELKKNAKERAEMTQNINAAKDRHEKIRNVLKSEFGIQHPTRNDITRYKLYLELESNGFKTFYTNTYVSRDKLFSKEFDIEHIIPKSRLFDDSFSNKTITVRQVNIDKGERTAYDFIEDKYGEESLKQYVSRIESLYKEQKISKAKYKKLLLKGSEIGEGFIERDLRESQYIAKKAREILLEICRFVTPTTGSITDKLREDWDLINVMKELNLDKYRNLGLTEIIERKDGQKKEQIIDWTKRNDHRHHAMDALTVAFTKHNHIQYLNNLNARKNENSKKHSNIIGIEKKETFKDENNKRRFNPPLENFRAEAKKHLENTLVSFKAKNKVVTRNRNKIKGSDKVQISLTPRGQLHKETIYGSSLKSVIKEVKIGVAFDEEMISKVTKPNYRTALLHRLKENCNNPKKAFGGKNAPTKTPITIGNATIPEKVKIQDWETVYTIRKEITPDLKIDKVIDEGAKQLLQKRLDEFGGKAKEAFSDLDKNPIWLNKEKGIQLKRVKITGISNAQALHSKKDHHGNLINNEDGKPVPSSFVSTGNNHHVAIYKGEKGKLQEEVVSFFDAVERVNLGLPIILKNHPENPDWEFQFTMKQNEMFVFPSDGFDPKEVDLLNPDNYHLISPNLYRIQKIATKNYMFRNHLETSVEEKKELKDVCYINIRSTAPLANIVKVRLNHLGQIVKVGE